MPIKLFYNEFCRCIECRYKKRLDVFVLDFRTSFVNLLIGLKYYDGMANNADPDQTAPSGLHCLLRHVFLNI